MLSADWIHVHLSCVIFSAFHLWQWSKHIGRLYSICCPWKNSALFSVYFNKLYAANGKIIWQMMNVSSNCLSFTLYLIFTMQWTVPTWFDHSYVTDHQKHFQKYIDVFLLSCSNITCTTLSLKQCLWVTRKHIFHCFSCGMGYPIPHLWNCHEPSTDCWSSNTYLGKTVT